MAALPCSARPEASTFPDAVVVALDANLGYGAAANHGLMRAAHDYVLVVNADVRAEPGAVAQLLDCAASLPRAAALGPQLVGLDGSPQVSAFRFPTILWRGRPAVTSSPMRWKATLPRSRRGIFLVGAALLLRRERVLDVGGFDPAFFMYLEEVDLCYRLRRRGWSIEHCPQSRFVHVGGASTRADRAYFYREQLRSHLRYMRKHHGRAAAGASHVVLVAALAARTVRNHRDPHDPAAALRWLVRSRTETVLTETGDIGRT
jgi:N-acetylglucosaminyl-diphospho-decaprenol L-rhamnosyltransferase